MIDFDYKTLPKDTKRLATVFWVHHLFEITETHNPNQLLRFMCECKQNNNNFIRDKPNNFFYMKWKGQLMQKENNLNMVEQILPGSTETLVHPIWRLLDLSCLTLDYLLSLKKQLAIEIQQELSKAKLEEPKGVYRQLQAKNNLDGFTGLLWFHYYQRLNNPNEGSNQKNYEILKYTLRLLTFTFSKIDDKFKFLFFKKVCSLFPSIDRIPVIRRVTLTNFPYFFQQIIDKTQFKLACRTYQQLAEKIIEKDDIAKVKNTCDINKVKGKYLVNLNHFALKTLMNNLDNTKGICLEERNTELGKLRNYYHIQSHLPPMSLLLKFFTMDELKSTGLITRSKEFQSLDTPFW
jgi:hypothetical protein